LLWDGEGRREQSAETTYMLPPKRETARQKAQRALPLRRRCNDRRHGSYLRGVAQLVTTYNLHSAAPRVGVFAATGAVFRVCLAGACFWPCHLTGRPCRTTSARGRWAAWPRSETQLVLQGATPCPAPAPRGLPSPRRRCACPWATPSPGFACSAGSWRGCMCTCGSDASALSKLRRARWGVAREPPAGPCRTAGVHASRAHGAVRWGRRGRQRRLADKRQGVRCSETEEGRTSLCAATPPPPVAGAVQQAAARYARSGSAAARRVARAQRRSAQPGVPR